MILKKKKKESMVDFKVGESPGGSFADTARDEILQGGRLAS